MKLIISCVSWSFTAFLPSASSCFFAFDSWIFLILSCKFSFYILSILISLSSFLVLFAPAAPFGSDDAAAPKEGLLAEPPIENGLALLSAGAAGGCFCNCSTLVVSSWFFLWSCSNSYTLSCICIFCCSTSIFWSAIVSVLVLTSFSRSEHCYLAFYNLSFKSLIFCSGDINACSEWDPDEPVPPADSSLTSSFVSLHMSWA